jgi:hypothetical protein
MSLVIFDRRHLVLLARSLTAAVGVRFLPIVRNSVLTVAGAGCWKTRAYLHAAPAHRRFLKASRRTTAIDRLVEGEVPAAVVALVSADAAQGFPEIAGFKIFRIPLSPTFLKARP